MELADTQAARRRPLAVALTVGTVVALLLGGYVMLVWCYGRGGQNIPYMKNWAIGQNWYFTSLRQSLSVVNAEAAQAATQGTAAQAAAPTYPTAGLISAGVGSLMTLVLTFLRLRFAGFWLHPIGYILGNTYFTYMVWGSLLVAWVVKWVALRIGGPRLVREKMTSFFAGVFVGGVGGMLFWDVVALVLLGQGVRDVYTCVP